MMTLTAPTSWLQTFYARWSTRAQGSKRGFRPNVDTTSGDPKGGCVYLVGAGPGDVQFLTLKAYQLLQTADVVLVDSLVDASVLDAIPSQVEVESVGKRCGQHSMPQQQICQRLVTLAQQGKCVVRLKGGDPGIFARTCEETDALNSQGIPFAIVPGVTAAAGASAMTGIPLTCREIAPAVRFMTAHLQDEEQQPDWPQIAQRLSSETLVVYMGLRRLPLICQALLQADARSSLPVAVVENACTTKQQLITGNLEDIAARVEAAEFQGPALLIFGDVVSQQQNVSTELLQAALTLQG